ncbi:uncharacterized protein M6B38_157090 [Iris pallida]|uniref:DUF7795 domain-containing protein n=1 Tax=Iris pallida TaxID=29817 RepID=A0AAX6F1S6_IRIPA|nr:uncharacterized protein M6B38_157090 [Iris pallida]
MAWSRVFRGSSVLRAAVAAESKSSATSSSAAAAAAAEKKKEKPLSGIRKPNGGVKEEEVRMVSDNRASYIFGEFMSRTAKFEDLVNNIGHQFLTGFCRELEIFKRPHIYKTSDVVDNIIEANQTDRMKAYVDAGCRQRHHDVQNMCNIHSCRQGLEDHLTKEIFKRPHIYKTSDVVDNIIEANQTDRMKAYVDAGCRQRHHDVQNMCNIHSCRQGLEDHLTKVKHLLDELETLKKEAMDIAWMVNDSSSRTFDPNFDDGVEYEGLPLEEGNTMDSMGIQNKSISYATLMTVVYNMLKLDYAMQEKIISSVSLMDTSSEQVESYCTMWDLRPYVDDNVMRQAWKFVR